MILTVTMNPSIDISYPIDHLKLDTVNRVSSVSKTAGGKGLNVTRVLQALGSTPLATGVLGGYLGKSIEEKLDGQKIKHQFLHIADETRNSIAILHNDGKQTEILETGPTVTKEEQTNFIALFQQLMTKVDLVTISGSLPKGMSEQFYPLLLTEASTLGLPVFLDTSNRHLATALQHRIKPTLIKPNLEEANELLHTSFHSSDLEEMKTIFDHPLFEQIPYVVITLGKEGALAKLNQQIYYAKIPNVQAKNPVGSGDATIAGFAHAYHLHADDEEILKTGMTAGVLNAMESQTGHIDPTRFQQIYQQIQCIRM